jgi:hypothetical protein
MTLKSVSHAHRTYDFVVITINFILKKISDTEIILHILKVKSKSKQIVRNDRYYNC